MKFPKKLKRTTVLLLAFILAATSSLAVYATVSYDSSKDPVVSLSGMKAYVESILSDIKSSIYSLESRMTLLEALINSGYVPPSGGDNTTSGAPGVSLDQLQSVLDKIEELEKQMEALEDENASLKEDLTNAKNELGSLISDLTTDYEALSNSIKALSTDITNLQNQITSTKNDLITLSKNFSQISDISTKLETLTYRVNALTAAGGDVTVLKNQVSELRTKLDGVMNELGKVYEVVFVPYGATLKATDADDTVMLVLRSGSAVAVSPYVEAGTMQGLNDLTLGIDVYNGESIAPFHSIMIPRGGADGRGVTVTSLEGAYFLLGGDYTVVEP